MYIKQLIELFYLLIFLPTLSPLSTQSVTNQQAPTHHTLPHRTTLVSELRDEPRQGRINHSSWEGLEGQETSEHQQDVAKLNREGRSTRDRPPHGVSLTSWRTWRGSTPALKAHTASGALAWTRWSSPQGRGRESGAVRLVGGSRINHT